MQIALIEACNPDWLFKRFSYSLGLGYISSFLKKFEPNIEIVICEEIEEVEKLKPHLLGISSYSLNWDIAKNWAKKIKESLGIPIIAGGCHISSLPETLTGDFDLAVLREGEETFLQVVRLFQKEGFFTPSRVGKIPGLAYVSGGELYLTPPRSPISRLDRLPYPARHLFPIRSSTHYISTSRGCPFQCLFCAPRIIWDKTRFFSAGYVMKEILSIIEQFADKFTHLMVVDDLFITNKERLKQLHKMFTESGINKILTLQGNVRADLINDETAKILYEMGFRTASFGAESGSDRILKYYDKKTTAEDNRRTIDILYNNGIKAIPSFIIGAPPETAEDLDLTLDFIEKNHGKMDGFEVFPLIPMPGSLLWSYAREKGVVDNNIRWSRLEPLLLDFNPDDYFYLIESISREKFIKYIKKFQDIYKAYNPAAMKFRQMLEEMRKKQ